jgi:hypothetical protein
MGQYSERFLGFLAFSYCLEITKTRKPLKRMDLPKPLIFSGLGVILAA